MANLAPLFGENFVNLPPDPSFQMWPPETGFTAEHIGVARHTVSKHLTETLTGRFDDVEGVVERAELVISEIVTNALRHRLSGVFAGVIPGDPEHGIPAQAYVAAADKRRKLVSDRNRPASIEIDEAEWGHGLELVEVIADTLSVSRVRRRDAHPGHRRCRVRSRKLIWATFVLDNTIGQDGDQSSGGSTA